MLHCGDNLPLLRRLADQSVDLVYIDPPYASGNRFAGAYDDDWPDLDVYLEFLRPRLNEMRRILTRHGSLFVHLDHNAAHYVKIELDRLFGREHFRGEIVWLKIRVKKAQAAAFPRLHDTILWYSRSERFHYQHQYAPLDPAYIRSHYPRGEQLVSLIQDGAGPPRQFGDRVLSPPAGKHWIWSQARIDEAFAAGRIRFTRSGRPRAVRTLAQARGNVIGSVWTDIPPVNSQAAERSGWPTQKPLALVERIIAACSRPGDLVADFFCGSGTTGVAAARLGRRFLLCDVHPAAMRLARKRLSSCQPVGAEVKKRRVT